jgi:DNA polymerase-3 subunit delta
MKSKSEFYPVVLLYGEDNSSKESFLENWIEEWIPKDMRSLNLTVLHGSEITGDEVVSSALCMPMFSDYRGIVVRHADKISASRIEAVVEYVQNPSPSTTLVLEAESIDKRQKAWKTIVAAAHAVEFKIPYPDKIPEWIIKRCSARYKRKINPDAASLLHECVGNDLGELDSELGKLDLFLTAGAAISVSHVEERVGARGEDIFKFLQAIGEKQCGKAVRLVNYLLESDPSPIRIYAMLAKHFYTLLKIRQLIKDKTDEQAICAALGLNHFFHFKKLGFGKQAGKYSIEKLENVLEGIEKADRLAKSTNQNPQLALSALVLEICQKENRPA